MRGNWLVGGLVVAGLALPSAAGAVGTGTLDSIKLPDTANSIAAGADGSVFVTLTNQRKVARVAPDGTVSESPDLGGAPAGIVVAEGRVWAAVTSLKKVARLDPADLTSVAFTDTFGSRCGPVGLAAPGDGKVYASLPGDGATPGCMGGTPSSIVAITAAGVAAMPVDGRGQAFDLAAAGGNLWVPDFAGQAVRRLSLDAGLTVTGTYATEAGSQPQGIGVAPDGQIAVSLWGTNSVARVPAAAADGTAMTTLATQIPTPAGVSSVGNSLFVAGSATDGGSPVLRRFPTDNSLSLPITPLAGSKPWDVAPGPDGTALFTDLNVARLMRFTSRAPRATTGDVFENNGAAAKVALSANPGGNLAAVTVQYGPTTDYGSTAVAIPDALPDRTSDFTLRAELTGLQLGATYHYRAVAVTLEGTAFGVDRTFTAPTKGVPPGGGAAAARPTIKLTRSTKKGVLKVTKIRVTGLTGGETIKVTCAGAGCPTKKKDRTVTTTAKKAGDLTVSAKKITSAELRKGAKVTVQVTKTGTTGAVTTATVTKKKKFDVLERCLAPGATKPSKCTG